MNQLQSFKHSNSINPLGIITAPLIGMLVAAALAVVYGYLLFYNPFIYVSFLATAGFASLTGFAIGYGAQIGKIRNPLFVGFLGLCGGMIANYFGWVVWIYAGYDILALNPIAIVVSIPEIAASIPWRFSDSNPEPFIFYGVWIAEALVIVGMTTYFAHDHIASTPYCEKCDKWLDDEKNVTIPLASSKIISLKEDLQKGEFKTLLSLIEVNSEFDSESLEIEKPSDTELLDNLFFTLKRCPDCEKSNFVTIQQQIMKREKNEIEVDKTITIVNLGIIAIEKYNQLEEILEGVVNTDISVETA